MSGKADKNLTTARKLGQQADFLGQLTQGNTVKDACGAAGISRQTAYEWRQADETFALAWADAMDFGTDVLEQEAKRRAVEGVLEPVWHQGEACGTVRKYSDSLLMFLLKGRRPERFRDQAKIEHSGSIDGKQTITVEGGALAGVNPASFSPELQDRIAEELDAMQAKDS